MRILAEHRFRMRIHSAPRKTWWDVLLGWLGDRWNQLADAFAHHVHIGAGTSVAAGDLILAVTAGIVLIVLIRLLAGYIRETPQSRGTPFAPPHFNADALHRRSLEAADAGDYTRAVTLLFRAALAALDVRVVLHDQPSFTVNECRREVAERAPRFLPAFDTIARLFTAAIYADAGVTAAHWNSAREAYAQLGESVSHAA